MDQDQQRDADEERYLGEFCPACGASPCTWDGQPDGFHTETEPITEFECCGQWLPYPEPGQEIRCPGCGDRFISALPPGWREWTSPQGISHAVPPSGPCATCGRYHDNDQET